MAILWKFANYDHPTRNFVPSHEEVTHEGLVVAGEVGKEISPMSGEWCTAYSCTVYVPEKGTFEALFLRTNFELDGSKAGYATVDAPPALVALYKARVVEAEAARQAAAAALDAERTDAALWAHANAPEHGKLMVVRPGRKGAGTLGRVFWMRDGRVGLALDEVKDGKGRHVNVLWSFGTSVQNAPEGTTLPGEGTMVIKGLTRSPHDKPADPSRNPYNPHRTHYYRRW